MPAWCCVLDFDPLVINQDSICWSGIQNWGKHIFPLRVYHRVPKKNYKGQSGKKGHRGFVPSLSVPPCRNCLKFSFTESIWILSWFVWRLSSVDMANPTICDWWPTFSLSLSPWKLRGEAESASFSCLDPANEQLSPHSYQGLTRHSISLGHRKTMSSELCKGTGWPDMAFPWLH